MLRILAGIVFGLVVLLVASVLMRPPDEAMKDMGHHSALVDPAREWLALVKQNFASDEACHECHAAQFEAHQRSGHSRTAHPMEETELAGRLTGTTFTDLRRDQQFRFSGEDDQFVVSIGKAEPNFPVHWLLGSGVHAQTPVSIDPVSGHGVEFRWSWITPLQMVGLTPDHDRFDDYRPHSLECFGRPLAPEQALACVNCHMTAVPPLGVAPTRDLFVANVNCERCHGPRKRHVELAHKGRATEVKPLLTYDDRESYMNHCAQCHRDERNIPPNSSPETIARFQPYGLKKSRCYQESDSLTCSTCHDPHDHVARDPAVQRENCRQCHHLPDQTLCTHDPEGDCVQCHMPSMEWDSGITFHDHWIRIPETPTGAQAPKDPMHSTNAL